MCVCVVCTCMHVLCVNRGELSVRPLYDVLLSAFCTVNKAHNECISLLDIYFLSVEI